MTYKVKDHYFHRAKKENYLARAIYKLQEIQEKNRIIHKGDRVLDLGAAPGSWLQYVSPIVGPSGLVVGIDLKEMNFSGPAQTITLQGDIFSDEFMRSVCTQYGPFNVVLSDMAPATSGIRSLDSARSALLVEAALKIALEVLKPGGYFLAKIFQGEDFNKLFKNIKSQFSTTRIIKPDASKKESKEIYFLAKR